VIVSLALTTIWNKIFPSEPTVIKEVSDSLQVTHNHNFGDSALTIEQINNQLDNLRILNQYEEEVEERVARLNESNKIKTNPIIIEDHLQLNGWIPRNGSNFFSLNCPESLDKKILDFHLSFFDDTIIDNIEIIRLLIYRVSSDGKESIYSDTFYKPQKPENIIRIGNGFENGNYIFSVGFIFKKSLKEEYPEFLNLKCKMRR
jgi:hypothetical protein